MDKPKAICTNNFSKVGGINIKPEESISTEIVNGYPNTIFCPKNVVCFLCLLHFIFFHGSKQYNYLSDYLQSFAI